MKIPAFFYILQRNLLLIIFLTGCQHTTPVKTNTLIPSNQGQIPEVFWPLPDESKLPLSHGDRVRVKVDEGDVFNGTYEVNLDGCFHIPYLDPIPVVGLSIAEAEAKLIQTLVNKKIYQPGFNGASLKILQWAKIQVYVKGAVFRPGRVMINDQLVAEQTFQQTQESGDYSVNRYLSSALKGAGGIRPDADLAKIKLTRNGKTMVFNFWGIFLGGQVNDIPLIANDMIEILSTGKIQPALIRPSQITPPGFQIFMSNLSQPISGNAQAAVGKASRDTPYGSRLLDGAIAANCVGGSWVNSSRKILHSAKNPISGEIDVNIFDLDEIAENANDDLINPYLMPDDGIACFDSTATNVREVIRFFGDLLDPLTLAKLLSLI